MSRLIDADLLELDADYYDGEYWAVSIAQIQNAPVIEDRKKGKWILDDKSGRYRCSECLSVASRDDHGNEVLSDYCGVCGAEMEKA